jgi:hypothetical protein
MRLMEGPHCGARFALAPATTFSGLLRFAGRSASPRQIGRQRPILLVRDLGFLKTRLARFLMRRGRVGRRFRGQTT